MSFSFSALISPSAAVHPSYESLVAVFASPSRVICAALLPFSTHSLPFVFVVAEPENERNVVTTPTIAASCARACSPSAAARACRSPSAKSLVTSSAALFPSVSLAPLCAAAARASKLPHAAAADARRRAASLTSSIAAPKARATAALLHRSLASASLSPLLKLAPSTHVRHASAQCSKHNATKSILATFPLATRCHAPPPIPLRLSLPPAVLPRRAPTVLPSCPRPMRSLHARPSADPVASAGSSQRNRPNPRPGTSANKSTRPPPRHNTTLPVTPSSNGSR
ncbi:hypothetical protein, conserved in T. vivax [Trypanosoma vivax Y486]|uniref:Uncharacterized protein n=1 Tax=Trypanosoma vivax (strain Y486) TaxID=1055687 RepID=F9WL81_TRYVY|nr:hypothetical protein, conserved in T. vivax [Trypanosoma vivax Y486]|eukprot:CCD18268.1 hypothetical protein, conserved in T. vivax [Trypanosoma vivax Y486]